MDNAAFSSCIQRTICGDRRTSRMDNEGLSMTATIPTDSMLSLWGEAHDRLLKEVEAAEFLRLAPATLRQWRYKGHGPTYLKLRSRVVYRRSELCRFVADCGVQ